MLTLSNRRATKRGGPHRGVPEWVRRELQAHDANLDVIFYPRWAGSDQKAGEEAAGRFLVMARRLPRIRCGEPPIDAAGDLNTRDWGIIHVVETDCGAFKVPDRETVAHVRRIDVRNETTERWLRERRERADRARARRKEQRRLEREQIMVPSIRASLAGRVAVSVPAKIGG